MRNGWLLVVLGVIGVLVASRPASAQFFPRRGYGYGDGDWGDLPGAAALVGSDYRAAVTSQVAAQNRQFGQMADMQRNIARQSGIRNTLAAQGQSQVNAALSQQQADRDWWFQIQQQQAAQQRGSGVGMPMAAAGGLGPAPAAGGFGPADPRPEAALDIIKWPRALQDRVFAARRAQVEAPYRRSPPNLSTPTAADYENMVKTVDEMRAILEWQLTQEGGLATDDYEQAKAFLDQMRKEANQRAGGGPPAKPQ